MIIKLIPEDFVVEELTDWQPSAHGRVSVYELTKRKLDTFEAMRIVSAHTGVPLDRIAYVGLKDRQGVTTQLISIDGGRLDGRIQGIRWKYLGRSTQPLAPSNLKGNAFTIVVRDLGEGEVARVVERRARLERHGLIGYFDDQRFGSLGGGQGLPGRDLVRGNFEAVVRALIATPAKRDPLPEKKWKLLIQKAWGDWDLIAKKWGHRKGESIVQHLRKRPGDFAGALQRLPAKERAIHVFAYQSYIWNRSVALYLEKKLPRHALERTRYVGGELVWMNLPADAPTPDLVESFPLLDHTVEPQDPDVRAAIDQALAEEGLTIPTFKIEGIPGCFFKHHERPLRVFPEALKVGQPVEDDKRPGRLKVELSFRLPPGAYATLVLQRLFGESAQEGERALRDERRKKKKQERKDEKRAESQEDGRAPRREERARPLRKDERLAQKLSGPKQRRDRSRRGKAKGGP
jgi:tRNA pseudouridine13 synthase